MKKSILALLCITFLSSCAGAHIKTATIDKKGVETVTCQADYSSFGQSKIGLTMGACGGYGGASSTGVDPVLDAAVRQSMGRVLGLIQ